MTEAMFRTFLVEHKLPHTEEILSKFRQYLGFLTSENKLYNLTAITEADDVYEKHFFDSAMLLTQLSFAKQRVCDVGAGAGFPGVPLLLLEPSLSLVPLDATAKKIAFLQKLAETLQLTHFSPLQARAESYQGQPFDVVVARGVAALPVLLELVANLVKPQGMFVAMKGPNYQHELEVAQPAMKCLGYRLIKVESYELPTLKEARFNLFFQKVANHPCSYPRQYAKIKQRPLQ